MKGKRAKSYEIWGRLSQGGMSEVWLAKHAELALPVVLKTMLPNGVDPFQVRWDRLLAEARIMARLASPRVVRVMDVGVFTDDERPEIESVPFLVEEYVDGIDLAELDARRRKVLGRALPLAAVAELLADACEGLHAAHQAGVIHRDVKPGNLFATAHGEVKVGDFGVSVDRQFSGQVAPAGTLVFMSPEQMLGEPLDRRSDVYSLGATAFALRYGRPPFETLADAIRPEAEPRFPPASTPEEAYFQHVVARMLARRPDGRYAGLRDVQRRLRHVSTAARQPLVCTRLGPNRFLLGTTRVTFEHGDIADAECDAIVNSAYADMTMRGGVGRALVAKGGESIEAEAIAGGERALGECVATGAGTLHCREVLHAVGAWSEVSCVSRATYRALLLAEERGHTRVVLPAIGTGLGRVSIESCADAMISTLRWHLVLGGSRLVEVRCVLRDADDLARFAEVAQGVLAGQEDPHAEEHAAPPTQAEATSDPTVFAVATPAPSTNPARPRTERLDRPPED